MAEKRKPAAKKKSAAVKRTKVDPCADCDYTFNPKRRFCRNCIIGKRRIGNG